MTKKTSKAAKTVFWIIGIVIIVFLLLFVTFLISERTVPAEKNETNQTLPAQNASEPEPPEQNVSEPLSLEPFTYNNLSFTVEQDGSSIKYKTPIRIVERHGKDPVSMNFSLKTDPRNLKSISSTIDKMPNKRVYVSFEGSAFNCSDSTMAAISLGYFLGVLGVNASSAVTDPEMAADVFEVKTCNDSSSDVTIIILQSNSEAEITQEEDCIIAKIADCNSIATIDKITLSFIELGIKQGVIEPKEF